MKILLPYNAHPYTTANYARDALRRLGHEVDCWGENQEIPASAVVVDIYDLVLYVEGETSYNLDPFKDSATPRVWWAIDNHLRAGIRTEKEKELYGDVHVDDLHAEISKRFSRPQDLILTAQKETIDGVKYAPAYAKYGATVRHLPLAADISHKPLDIEPAFDVVFVGNCNWLHLRRRKLLDKLKDIYGDKMLECQAFGPEMVKALHLGKVVFNCSVVGDLNMRYFEALAAGRTLVTDVNIDLDSYNYDTDQSAIDMVAYALSDPCGWNKHWSNVVHQKHTYDVRMKELLKMVKKQTVAAKKALKKKTTTPIAPNLDTLTRVTAPDPLSLTLKFPDEKSKKAMLAHIANHSLFAGAQQPDGKVVDADIARKEIDKAAGWTQQQEDWTEQKLAESYQGSDESVVKALRERLRQETLAEQYTRLCAQSSDINEHLPTLFELAKQCKSIVEMGLRTGVSTTALLHGLIEGRKAQKAYFPAVKGRMLSWDIDAEAVKAASRFPAYSDPNCTFEAEVCNSLEANLSGMECELLFIDTLHTGQQLVQELFRHEPNVKHYIALHDTEAFGYIGEDGQPGLWTAVGKFLACKPEWVVMKHYENCNGLTILERCDS